MLEEVPKWRMTNEIGWSAMSQIECTKMFETKR